MNLAARASCALLLAVGATLAPRGAAADERILAYRSEIVVEADAGMRVTETIRVRAEGKRIRHGIYRDFPTDYRDRNGLRVRVGFEPRALERDGRGEAFRAQTQGNGVRVYFGSPDTTLAPGEYTYTFQYRTTRQLGFFADHDELYWNATGNGWDFPIDEAVAAVSLPGTVEPSRITVEAYTGRQGARGKDYAAAADGPSHATFRTTRSLGPREGLTIVAGFPKGVVAEPDAAQRSRWFVHDNAAVLVLAGGLLVVFAYYFTQWLRVGRDPKPGPIVPLYEAPAGSTPGALRYVERMGWDTRCIAADIVDLAVRGRLRIVQEGAQYRIERAPEPPHDGGLPPVEGELLNDLLGDSPSLTFRQSERLRIRTALKAHERRYEQAYAGSHFRKNTALVVIGVLITLATLGAAALLLGGAARSAGVGFILLWLSGWSLGVIALCTAAIGAWRNASGVLGAGGALFLTLFALPFVGGEIIGLGALFVVAGVAFGVVVIALIALNLLFRYLIKAPTPLGRRLLDQVEGLRLYLGVAERDDIAAQRAPPLDAEAYHRLLPYALALGVEKSWTDRFAASVGPAAAAAAATAAGWYAGNDLSSSGLAGFAGGFSSSLSSAIASSSSEPGSSSGGGGGGSSGGGGGGGGGGGW